MIFSFFFKYGRFWFFSLSLIRLLKLSVLSNPNLTDHCRIDASRPISICLKCENNTEGERCDRCKLGFFKISNDIRDGCRQCMCNGHGSLCNPFNGENCDCHNNTESDRQCTYFNSNSEKYSHYINKTYFAKSSQITSTYSLPCWMLQCSKCKDNFYGIPTNGHQCYRHMHIAKEYCLDPVTQNNCFHSPQPLLYGRTTFFGIQPRYMNVDIKLIVYSVDGRINLYLSSKDDMFSIRVNSTNGFHHIFIDKNYHLNVSSSENRPLYQEIENVGLNAYNSSLKYPYKLIIHDLNGQSPSYFTMKNWYEIMVFQNIQNRVEITIPFRCHDLRTTRYYLVIQGNNSVSNYGLVVLRQDQSRIDLFIFFCVFLSCFFMFLCLTIIFWQIKLIIALRRASHQQEIELEHLANRPFTKTTIILDDDLFFHNFPVNQSLRETPSKKISFLRHIPTSFKESHKIYPEDGLIESYRNSHRTPAPIAIEPTMDGMAAIFTTFLKLPGNHPSKFPLAAASSLISIKNNSIFLKSIQNKQLN